jgi:hypothetical protein
VPTPAIAISSAIPIPREMSRSAMKPTARITGTGVMSGSVKAASWLGVRRVSRVTVRSPGVSSSRPWTAAGIPPESRATARR